MMNEVEGVPAKFQQMIDKVIADWEMEASLWQGWREVPGIFSMARYRLPKLVELNAPELIIEGAIALTRARIDEMRAERLKGLH